MKAVESGLAACAGALAWTMVRGGDRHGGIPYMAWSEP